MTWSARQDTKFEDERTRPGDARAHQLLHCAKSSPAALGCPRRGAAAKLKSDTIEARASDELKGYEKSVPAYRLKHGSVRVNKGYTGWQELLGVTSSFAKRGNGQFSRWMRPVRG